MVALAADTVNGPSYLSSAAITLRLELGDYALGSGIAIGVVGEVSIPLSQNHSGFPRKVPLAHIAHIAYSFLVSLRSQ
jgi:hypothetical protein